MALPDFIIIGAMKAGTTSLARYLDVHPQIQLSRRKEPDFFSHDPTALRGLAWYESGFEDTTQLQFEASTNYTKYPFSQRVPERMHALLPHIKLVYILRDPVDRLRSHLHDGGRTGLVTAATEFQGSRIGSFESNRAVATSRYFMQLEQFLPFYPLDRILVVTLEDMSRDPQTVLNSVFAFLNVDPFESPEFSRVHHRSAQRERTITPLGRKLRRMVRTIISDVPAPRAIRWLASRRSDPPPQLDATLSDELRAFFRADVEALRRLTGQRFDDWSL
jgi:hypothetical protein